ncbi:Receptor protein kinase TMK1 [Camellia lanceoleosa]|uniref:Receptor protein kinase TMK1 n=1 Tax=Camellia lanceoleosa TaxID=1840588 RepID=A0ACC0I6Y6_9ERIC|nr:Receptor protein kinase TMK1 [Camellia lanceoleosa]
MTSLHGVYLDYNPFSPWRIPESLQNASALQVFSASAANIIGNIPEFFGGFVNLGSLHLAFNNLNGGLPGSFSGSSIQSLWLNGQQGISSKLNGSIGVIQNMTRLNQVWLHSNSFSGPLLELSGLIGLQNFSVRDNRITGLVPMSLVNLPSLKVVNLTNNLLQGPTPKFHFLVAVDMTIGTNSFCLSDPGVGCDSRVNTLLMIAQSIGYPTVFADSWKGNDPCVQWIGLTCSNGDITVVNFQKMGLSVLAIGVSVFGICRAKQKHSWRVQSPNAMVVRPHHSGSDHDAVKITIADLGLTGGTTGETYNHDSHGPSDIRVIEARNMTVTNNFSEENILGRGGLLGSFSGSSIQSLWLNGQQGISSKLNGSIGVIQNMTQLNQVWLHSNSFSTPLPELSGLTGLQNFSVRDNRITGCEYVE